SGPATATGSVSALGGIALPITPGKATHALNVPIAFDAGVEVLGAPRLSLTYKGTSPPGNRPTRVFAQLVDDSTGIVVGNQITPIEVTLDGKRHSTSVPMEIVAYTAKRGSHLTLQLVATTVAYAEPRLGGTINFESVKLGL